jgi:hypothetical protein
MVKTLEGERVDPHPEHSSAVISEHVNHMIWGLGAAM